jgi:4-diphosphocytidyl-2-C-methyl-D-erythritol kinase
VTAIEEAAPAKVNLDLCICGRRPDGYHELDSTVVFAEAGDQLSLAQAEDFALRVEGPFAAQLDGGGPNLAEQAARRLAALAGRPPAVHITLDKRLPVAAGLGGGSADAAATLRGLCRLWDLPLAHADLAPLAARLGADVPVCLAGQPARMTGIGERLGPLPVPACLPLLLVNPGLALPTAAVFKALGDLPPPIASGPPPADPAGLLAWIAARPNHLEPAALRLAPALGEVLAALDAAPGCRLARMSGSGATCFGWFADEQSLAAAAAALRAARPGWWVQPTRSLA